MGGYRPVAAGDERLLSGIAGAGVRRSRPDVRFDDVLNSNAENVLAKYRMLPVDGSRVTGETCKQPLDKPCRFIGGRKTYALPSPHAGRSHMAPQKLARLTSCLSALGLSADDASRGVVAPLKPGRGDFD